MIASAYALGPYASNPTSGGALDDYEQFLGVPQQQGSAVFTWALQGWHASTALTFAGKNNTLNQDPYMFTDVAVGKNFGHIDLTLAGTNIFNAVSGPFTPYDAGVPYYGLTTSGPGNLPTDRLFILPASVKFIVTVHE